MGTGAIKVGLCLISAAVLAAYGERDAAEFKTEQARQHYQKGLEYGDKGLWLPEILELNRARELEPGNAGILIELGVAYGERKDWKHAIASLRKAVTLAPASAAAHYNLALTLDRADPGKSAGAMEYRKVLKLNPRH